MKKELTQYQRHEIMLASRRIIYKLNFIMNAEENKITSNQIRTLCKDVHKRTDELLQLLDFMENK